VTGRTRIATTVGILALAALAPAVARADPQTFCVHAAAASCPAGGIPKSSVADAVAAADVNPGTDTIRLGPGTQADYVTATGFAPREPVTLIGAGSTATRLSGGGAAQVVLALPGGSSAQDLAIEADPAAVGALKVSGAGATSLQRLRLVGAVALDVSLTADVSVDSSLVRTLPQTDACGIRAAGAAVLARNVTIAGDSSPQSGTALCATAGINETTTITANSVAIEGLALHVRRSNTAGSATTSVSLPFTTYDPARKDEPGGATGSGSINATDALGPASASAFTDVNEPVNGFQLAPGSPLLDQGDSAALAAGESATDLDGNRRIAGSRRDVGAYERQPDTTTSGSGTGPPVGQTDPPDEPPGPPALVIAQRALRTSGVGLLRISVGCFGGDSTKFCTGTLSATTTRKYTLARMVPNAQKLPKAKPPVLKPFGFGSARYKVQVGRSGVVILRIPLAARKLLVRERGVTIRLTAVGTQGAAARAARATAVVRLNYAVPLRRTRTL